MMRAMQRTRSCETAPLMRQAPLDLASLLLALPELSCQSLPISWAALPNLWEVCFHETACTGGASREPRSAPSLQA